MEQTGSGYVSKNAGKALKYFRCRTSQRDKKRCPGQDYMPMEQLQELVLERVRHHIAGYLEPGKPGQELASFPRKNRNRAKRTELERLQGEIVRRRKAMQELYLDKSSGIISSAQFMELNQTFLHDVEDLGKNRTKKI